MTIWYCYASNKLLVHIPVWYRLPDLWIPGAWYSLGGVLTVLPTKTKCYPDCRHERLTMKLWTTGRHPIHPVICHAFRQYDDGNSIINIRLPQLGRKHFVQACQQCRPPLFWPSAPSSSLRSLQSFSSMTSCWLSHTLTSSSTLFLLRKGWNVSLLHPGFSRGSFCWL